MKKKNKLFNPNVKSAKIVDVHADLVNSKNKSQLDLTHFDENVFTMNSHNPKCVILLEKYQTFYDSEGIVNSYNSTDSDPNYYLSNATF